MMINLKIRTAYLAILLFILSNCQRQPSPMELFIQEVASKIDSQTLEVYKICPLDASDGMYRKEINNMLWDMFNAHPQRKAMEDEAKSIYLFKYHKGIQNYYWGYALHNYLNGVPYNPQKICEMYENEIRRCDRYYEEKKQHFIHETNERMVDNYLSFEVGDTIRLVLPVKRRLDGRLNAKYDTNELRWKSDYIDTLCMDALLLNKEPDTAFYSMSKVFSVDFQVRILTKSIPECLFYDETIPINDTIVIDLDAYNRIILHSKPK